MKKLILISALLMILSNLSSQNSSFAPFFPYLDYKRTIPVDNIVYELKRFETNYMKNGYNFFEFTLYVEFGKKDYIYIPVRVDFSGNMYYINLKTLEVGNQVIATCSRNLKPKQCFNLNFVWNKNSQELTSDSFSNPFYQANIKDKNDCMDIIAGNVNYICKKEFKLK